MPRASREMGSDKETVAYLSFLLGSDDTITASIAIMQPILQTVDVGIVTSVSIVAPSFHQGVCAISVPTSRAT